MIHPTAEVSEQVNRKCTPRIILQLLIPYTNMNPGTPYPWKFQNLRVWKSDGLLTMAITDKGLYSVAILCQKMHMLCCMHDTHMIHMQITWYSLFIVFCRSKFPKKHDLSNSWASCCLTSHCLDRSSLLLSWWAREAVPIRGGRCHEEMRNSTSHVV